MARQETRPRKSLTAVGVACLMLFTPSVSLAWGPEAHKIIAYIAFDELKPTAKRRVAELLLSPRAPQTIVGQAFVDASTWADDIRVLRPQFNSEHFIDRPFPGNAAPPQPNLLTALNKNLTLLRTSPDKNVRLEALKFIIHYVGDIHQPLHCSTRISSQYPKGDAGGNLFQIMVADAGGKPRTISLHSYWDKGLDNFSLSTFTVPQAADDAERAYSKRDPTTPDFTFNFQGWGDESFKLAQDAYVGVEEGKRVSVVYRSKGIATMKVQLARAGYRLGALLNAIWP